MGLGWGMYIGGKMDFQRKLECFRGMWKGGMEYVY